MKVFERTSTRVIWPSWLDVAKAIATYALSAAITIWTFNRIISQPGGMGANLFPFASLAHIWDGDWYFKIFEHGYDQGLVIRGDHVAETNLAFFPALPALIFLVSKATGLQFQYASLCVTAFAGLFAVTAIFILVQTLATKRAAFITVAFFAVLPSAIIEWLPYTEMLATATTLWALLAVMDRRWVLAGFVTLIAGTVRSSVVTLIAVVGLAALFAIFRRQDRWRPWFCAAVSPLGFIASILYIGHNGGRWDAWFIAEKAWHQKFDFGTAAWDYTKTVFTHIQSPLAFQIVPFMMLGAVICWLALVTDRRIPWVLVGITVLTMILAWGSAAAFSSKPRFLIPIAPILLIPAASSLARYKLIVICATIVSLGIMAGWYGVDLLYNPSHQAP